MILTEAPYAERKDREEVADVLTEIRTLVDDALEIGAGRGTKRGVLEVVEQLPPQLAQIANVLARLGIDPDAP